MARIDVADQSFRGTWLDGYLPGIEKMKDLALKYKHLDYDEHGLPIEYGFSQLPDAWKQEDYFSVISSAIRTKYDHVTLPSDVRPVPCLTWLFQIDKQPWDTKLQPIFEEYAADPRRQDYFHIVTVHEECPVKEGCLQSGHSSCTVTMWK